MTSEDRNQDQIPEGFWPQIRHQLHRIAISNTDSFASVREILLDPAYDAVVEDVNLNGLRTFDKESAFFAGSGGDATLAAALSLSGWQTTTWVTSYYYVMKHFSTGELLTYIEGDVQLGHKISVLEEQRERVACSLV